MKSHPELLESGIPPMGLRIALFVAFPFLILVGICIGIKDSLLWFNAEAGTLEAAIRAHREKALAGRY